MESTQITEVVKKLVGKVVPVGESNEDDLRFANLVTLCEVAEQLIEMIAEVQGEKGRHEYSIKRSGLHADAFLKNQFDKVFTH